MTLQAARRFIKQHGVVLEGGRGPVPNLAEAIAGESIHGSWWGHRRGHEIFWLTRAIRDWRDVLVCRLVGGKVTYVHRRLWPALIRLAARLEPDRLAALHEEHTVSGRHQVQVVPYPRWVPADVRKAARRMTEGEAVRMMGYWATLSLRFPPGRPDKRSQVQTTRRRRKPPTRSSSRPKRSPNQRTR